MVAVSMEGDSGLFRQDPGFIPSFPSEYASHGLAF